MDVTLSSDLLTVTINSRGAEICSITDKKGTEYIWQADKSIWPRHAPLLFPIVGRLKNNSFVYKHGSYDLSQHGFARDMEFRLVEKEASFCRLELKGDSETKKNYPFDFILQVGYLLDKDKLTCSYKVTNPSPDAAFFSIGAHPGFNCPIEKEAGFEDYYLEFTHKDEVFCTELENGLLTDRKQSIRLQNGRLFLKSELFDKDALVFERGQIDAVSLNSRTSSHKIRLECPDWPYFGIWTKQGQTRFLCLEPWYGIADRVNGSSELTEKEGIIKLEPGKDFQCSFFIQLS